MCPVSHVACAHSTERHALPHAGGAASVLLAAECSAGSRTSNERPQAPREGRGEYPRPCHPLVLNDQALPARLICAMPVCGPSVRPSCECLVHPACAPCTLPVHPACAPCTLHPAPCMCTLHVHSACALSPSDDCRVSCCSVLWCLSRECVRFIVSQSRVCEIDYVSVESV